MRGAAWRLVDGPKGPGGPAGVWYNEGIAYFTKRRLILGAAAALAAFPAAAQEPQLAVQAHGAPMGFAFPTAGPAAAGRLNQIFDAAARRQSLPGPVVAAPLLS